MLADYLSRYKSGFSLTFVILFSLSSLVWQSNILARSVSSFVEVLDFFTGTFNSMGTGITRLFDSYAEFSELKKERDALREKLKKAQSQKLQLFQLQNENVRLKQILGLPKSEKFPMVLAEVISQDPDNWFRTIIIDKGSAHGIKPYMPVIASQVITKSDDKSDVQIEELVEAVIGKVIQVNTHSSRIIPITDQYSRLGVQLKKSGHWGLLMGQAPHNEYPILNYMSLSVFIEKNDEIITSGSDGIFPKGLLVGTVHSEINRLGTYQTALIKPAVNFQKLDYVYIIQKIYDPSRMDFLPLNTKNVPEP